MVRVRVGGLIVMVRVSVGGLVVIVRVRSQVMHICEIPHKDSTGCVFMCLNEKQPKLLTRANFCTTAQVEFVIRALLLQYIIAAAGNSQYCQAFLAKPITHIRS